jgi:hypothetical protein
MEAKLAMSLHQLSNSVACLDRTGGDSPPPVVRTATSGLVVLTATGDVAGPIPGESPYASEKDSWPRRRHGAATQGYFTVELVLVSCGNTPSWKKDARVCAASEPPSQS